MIIYTSSSSFFYSSCKDKWIEPKNEAIYYKKMPNEEMVNWVSQRIEEMKNGKTRAESLFIQKLDGFKWKIENQVYFYISGKSYFLDFFVPALNLAFEVDGMKNHSSEEDRLRDFRRDSDFEKIGIHTVRFGYREIWRKDFRDKIFTKRVKDTLKGKISPIDYYDMSLNKRFGVRKKKR